MKKLEPIFAWVVKIGLFVIPFLPLYVSSSMLFPFITGKNFAFRIITEIIFIFWLWLAMADTQYRPKLTPLFKAVSIFVAIVFIADILGANPYRSLFSNYERMEGFMMIGHLYLYYLMLSSVFKKCDWMIFFHSTLAASLLVSYIGLTQKLGYRISIQGGFRIDSTIGNPTYLAAYLLFHLWIIAILMYAYRKRWWVMSLYGAAFIFELMILYFTATRGAIIALVVGAIAMAGAVIWNWSLVFPTISSGKTHVAQWPLGRKIAAGVLTFIMLVPFVFWLGRNTETVQSNQVLRRLTNYSLQEGTIQARFHIWGQSWQGFLERPIVGWGQENYYLVFQKYYNPKLWSDEPWFDRSHDIFFDWLIHTGLLGLAAYVSMYVFVSIGIIKGIKKQKLPFWSGIVVLVALFAHIIQNIFVFDNLNTYLLFFGFLAYGAFLIKESESEEEHPATTPKRMAGTHAYPRANAVALGCAAVLGVSLYPLHLAPIYQSKALIQALIVFQQHVPMDQQIAAFKGALSYDSFGTTEVREQMISVASNVLGNQRYSNEEQVQYATFAIDEMRKQTATPAKDVKHLMFLGTLLDQGLGTNPSYPLEAKNVLEEAVRVSPTKQMVAFELAQFYVLTGHNDQAADLLYRVWKLDPTYRVAAMHALVMAVVTQKHDIAGEIALLYPPSSLSEQNLLRLGEAYRKVQEYDHALVIYRQLVIVAPGNAKYHATLAALLANAGRTAEAREQVQKAIQADPSFAKDAGNFLQRLNN